MEEIPLYTRSQIISLLERLSLLGGGQNEVITIALPAKKKMSDVTSLITFESNESKNIKLKKTRKAILSTLEAIHVAATKKYYHEGFFEKGLVIFAGLDLENEKTKEIERVVTFFQPEFTLGKQIYYCSNSFRTDFLKEELKNTKVFFGLVLDKSEALACSVENYGIKTYFHLTSQVPGKQKHGGQSAMRFSRLRELALHEFLTTVSEKFNAMLAQREISGILLAGPGRIKNLFNEQKYLGYPYQDQVHGVYDCDYVSTKVFSELLEKKIVILDSEYSKIQSLFTSFKDQLAYTPIDLISGHSCLNNPEFFSKIETLLIKENHHGLALTLSCSYCTTTRTYFVGNVVGTHYCPVCNNKEVILTQTPIYQELIKERYLFAKVQVSPFFEEYSYFLNHHGGLFIILKRNRQA